MHLARRSVFLITAALAAAFVAGTAMAKDRLAPIAPGSGFAWIAGDDSIAHEVERSRVKKGIPKKGHPRDVIPPIDRPVFYASHAKAKKDLGLSDEDRVLGVVFGDDARAYPTRILDRHEIANDTVGGKPLAVVW